MRTTLLAVLGLLLLATFVPEQAQAQDLRERAREAIERERERQDRQQTDRRQTERDRASEADRRQAERDRAREADRRNDARRPQQQRRATPQTTRQNAPPFCRNGSGHPVHGMAWCHEKGYTSQRWTSGSLGSIIFDRRIVQDRRSGTLTSRQVETILGRDGTRRANNHARQLGMSGNLTGRWIEGGTLELLVGGAPLARLTDTRRDGRVDQVMLIQR